MGLRHGKRSRARSTNDLAAHGKESANNSTNAAAATSVFKKGHNRSRSDVNYRPSAFTDNGLVDSNTLKNMILNQQQEAEKSLSSGSVVKQGALEHREGTRGRWLSCHVELTPCELRLYTLDSSANRQLGTAYSLSHCQSAASPALGQPAQPADPRTLQAVFFNSTVLHLRASCQWEALEWRRAIWETVQAAKPKQQQQKKFSDKFPPPVSSSPSPCGLDTRPDLDSDSPTPDASLSSQSSSLALNRPTTLPLFTQRCPEVLKAGLLYQLVDHSNWRAYTFVLTRTTLQVFPQKGEHGPDLWTERADCFQAVFSKEVVRLRADGQSKAEEWVRALQGAVEEQRPAHRAAAGAEEEEEEEGAEVVEGAPGLQGVLLRSRPSRDRKHREAQRAKRQSVTTSFLSLLTCLSVEKGLTAQSFKCAGETLN
ncbi:hypothetical protein WMY93_001873 [Mugilogobius chulae]|uniref:PH domain-containing protein n=1 Tax=Mugilogobius chulae TaxID=88201 RepID=A0AAW0Q2V5_9GOBI